MAKRKVGGRTVLPAGLLLWTLFGAGSACGAELSKKTVDAFKQYVSVAEGNMQRRVSGKKPFLRVDAQPAQRKGVLAGQVPIEQIEEVPGFEVPDGMIHDWAGSVFIPASPGEILAVLRDYDRHKDIYPEAIDSRTIESSPERLVGYLRLKKTKVITVVLDTEHEVFYQQLPGDRWYIHSYSTKINEISDFGDANQRILPEGEGHGFLWELYAYWFLAPTDGGTIAECRAISLTRDIPFLISWMVRPFVTALPRESLTETLQATRDAVVKRKQLQSPN
jgi:hypothetical protein